MSRPIGVITALPHEYHAVRELLDGAAEQPVPGGGARYCHGYLPSADPLTPHRVVLTHLAVDGVSAAAVAAVELTRTWSAGQVLLCGVACAVPVPTDPDRHVRLGDVLVAVDGVVPYDQVRHGPDGSSPRRPAPRPSRLLVEAAQAVRRAEEDGVHPCAALPGLTRHPGLRRYRRPAAETDLVYRSDTAVRPIEHPYQPDRRPGLPMVHYGRLGSGGTLLRSQRERSRLAAMHRVIGFEMEGGGLAEAAYLSEVPWFMVRGACDYGDGRKSDTWQRYAALAAACYTRSLLGACPPVTGGPAPAGDRPEPGGPELPATETELAAITEALLGLDIMIRPDARDSVISMLPDPIARVTGRSPDATFDVINLVRTAAGYPGGLAALADVLGLLLGDSRSMRRVAAAIGPVLARCGGPRIAAGGPGTDAAGPGPAAGGPPDPGGEPALRPRRPAPPAP